MRRPHPHRQRQLALGHHHRPAARAQSGQQRGAGELTWTGQTAWVAGGRQRQPDLVRWQLREAGQRVAQRQVGPGTGCVGDQMPLVAGDLVAREDSFTTQNEREVALKKEPTTGRVIGF